MEETIKRKTYADIVIDDDIVNSVIYNFQKRIKLSQDECLIIWEETKKWLWMASECRDNDFNAVVTGSLAIIDEMWHTFILHTKAYHSFCLTNFGKFIHHFPASGDGTKASDNQIDNDNLRKQLYYINDVFGESTLTLWYKNWSEKYSQEKLNLLRK